MLIDLEQVSNSDFKPEKAAVCIAGAGIAGLVLATALAEAGIDVHLLEGGGQILEERSQDIYDAEMANRRHEGTTKGRFRVFGGSSTRWGGQLLPFSDEIFSPPPGLACRGWPIKQAVLQPFYRRVEKILGADHLPFSTELFDALGKPIPAGLALDPKVFLRFSKWAPFAQRNLGQTLGRRAIPSTRITVFLHANLMECLLSSDGSSVEAFLVRNYRGERFRFEAQRYVLAAGTIETSRLLLASRSVDGRGVGNHFDQVGRGFHDHVSMAVAKATGEAQKAILSSFGPFLVRGTAHVGRLEATPILREQLGLLAVQAHFNIEESPESGIFVVRHLLRSMQRGDFRSAVLQCFPRLPQASWDIVRLAWNAKVKKARVISSKAIMPLEILCEQRAQSGNRIRLAERRWDNLGMLKAIVDWRVSTDEIQSMLTYAGWLRAKFAQLGVKLSGWHPNIEQRHCPEPIPVIRDTNHPMGGTVMGADPRCSVVDEQLTVHGVPNLSIASCSTYPTGGSSNPTFTMIALTLRLAEHVACTLTRGAVVSTQKVLKT